MRTASHVRIHTIMTVAVGLVLVTSVAKATSVVPMDLDTLADHSGQVIVGTVTAVRSYWADSPRRIESEIAFEETEYLKGTLPDSRSTFTLVVPGGTVGQTSMQLAGTPTFAVGEKWVLFLLPSYKTFPVVGLSQGAFRVQAGGDGVERVFASSGSPVVGIDPTLMVTTAGSDYESASEHLIEAVSARLISEGRSQYRCETGLPAGQAMSYQQFLARVQPILDGSHDHKLTGPAGRRVLVEFTPVPPAPLPPNLVTGDSDTRCQAHSPPRSEVRPRKVTDTVDRPRDKR